PLVVRARWIVCGPERVLEGASLVVRGGRVERVTRARVRVARAREVDLGNAIVAAGMINAHAHLELGALAGRTPRGSDFAAWVRTVIALRSQSNPSELVAAARAGARRALTTGTTCVLDVDTTSAAARALARHPIRSVVMREVLDAHDGARTQLALERVRRPLRAAGRRREGLSPHAPFTVSPALLAGAARIARARSLPVQMHWSETEAEVQWMSTGSGPLSTLLGASPRRLALDLLEEAGLLGPRLSLVHGNLPARGEARRLARRGVTLVHCPFSHAWFRRERWDWHGYARAGVEVALGTDSLASNEDLDLRRELRLAADTQPWLSPEALWRAATVAGARAAGASEWLGRLEPGFAADFLVLAAQARSARSALEELCLGATEVGAVWVEGRCVPFR
ncbi:MAG: amidohydrolase family protein, partial [Planctomycetes bacterium]|nr:amidohydrolase family protein [Planctomycetota bacterium]